VNQFLQGETIADAIPYRRFTTKITASPSSMGIQESLLAERRGNFCFSRFANARLTGCSAESVNQVSGAGLKMQRKRAASARIKEMHLLLIVSA
jgi:hypothetical protein